MEDFDLWPIIKFSWKMASTKRAPEGAPEVPDVLVNPTPGHAAKYEKGRFLGKVITVRHHKLVFKFKL